MNYKAICLICSLLTTAHAAYSAELCGQAIQGGLLVGKIPGVQEVHFNQTNLTISPDGTFLLGLGRDEAPKGSLVVSDGKTILKSEIEIAPTRWDIQNLKGVPPRKVTPADSDLRDIEKEQKLIRAAQATRSQDNFWQNGFIMPVEGRISGNFGGQRIMNGIKKNPHAGMDIAVKDGTPVHASAGGTITLAYPGLFYSGNVIVIDHGLGLHTVYAHLSEIKVRRGDVVKPGQVIGLSGHSGRVTGPHLHWGASVNGTKINPLSLSNINKADDFCFNL